MMFARLSLIASGLRHEEKVEQVSLAELNDLLNVLADVFPKHEVAFLRNLLLDASHESRLQVVANVLVEHPQRYSTEETRLQPGLVADWEKFRSTKYKKTVKRFLTSEYQGLARSTISNVLAENNHDYARSRDALADIASRSWRFNIATWITRRKTPPPLPCIDVLKNPTGCVCLDDEIYALRRPERDEQSLRDEQLARKLNENEHAEAHALFECECCFGDFTWEDTTVCTGGHFFCRGCLNRSVNLALYGQGNCLRADKASVRCISSVATPPCDGFVMPLLLPHSLPPETLAKMTQQFARDELQSTGLRLLCCPGCSYAVADSTIMSRLRPQPIFLIPFLAGFLLSLFLAYPRAFLALLALPCTGFLLFCTWDGVHILPTELRSAPVHIKHTMARVRRRKTGIRQLLKCENPNCGMESCIDCGRTWAAFHDCRREMADSQRLHVERAMSEAIKRTCPECRTSFVKTEGCNKLTCPCGYQMCYVCRAGIRNTRYHHFCPHFRAILGAACTECDKCNLYETEDEQAVAAAAARCAAAEWTTSRRGEGTLKNVEIEPISPLHGTWPPWAEMTTECLIELLFKW